MDHCIGIVDRRINHHIPRPAPRRLARQTYFPSYLHKKILAAVATQHFPHSITAITFRYGAEIKFSPRMLLLDHSVRPDPALRYAHPAHHRIQRLTIRTGITEAPVIYQRSHRRIKHSSRQPADSLRASEYTPYHRIHHHRLSTVNTRHQRIRLKRRQRHLHPPHRLHD